MRILIWATTFGSDLWSLARRLDARRDVELRIVMPDPAIYLNEPVAKLFPLKSPIHHRRLLHDLTGVPFFRPDITILDNRVPLRGTSRAGFVLWHGFGWKGPNDLAEFRVLHSQLRRAWGDPLRPNPRFRWQTFGPWDFEHRTEVSGFHPDNCRILGAASHDDLREPLDRSKLQAFFPFDIRNRKTVLFAPTWHYGEVFAHWGRDADLMNRLATHLEKRNANLLVRLHDSNRFDRRYRAMLEQLARSRRNVLLKFKDRNPDNFIDMQISDVLLTNYSSIANLFYATRRPTVHIYPVRSADEAFLWRRQTILGTMTKKVDSVRFIWKLPPETHGGLLAYDFGTMLKQVDQGLDDPTCCAASTRAFLDEHMLGADGKNCDRVWDALVELDRTSRGG